MIFASLSYAGSQGQQLLGDGNTPHDAKKAIRGEALRMEFNVKHRSWIPRVALIPPWTQEIIPTALPGTI